MANENEVKMAKCYLGNNRQVEGPAELVSAYINSQNRVRNLKQNFALAMQALRDAGLPNPCLSQETKADDSDNPFID